MLKRFWKWLGFHVHEFTPWTRIEVDRVLMFYDGRPNIEQHNVKIQMRQCMECGWQERRDI